MEYDVKKETAGRQVADWLQLPYHVRHEVVCGLFEQAADETIDELLALVKAPEGLGVYASIGPNYHYAIFGRDSLEVAEDLVAIRPQLSREILLSLAALMGREHNNHREEERGKIIHEYRARQFGSISISAAAEAVFERLAPRWGGDERQMRYYGSIDATPLFVRTLGAYVALHGTDILEEELPEADGGSATLRELAHRSVTWLADKLEASEWSLLEFHRFNPLGLPYQAWKDSETSYLHHNGIPANADEGIASAEVQGLAYDALQAGVEHLATSSEEAEKWSQLARQLQQETVRRLWMPEAQFFAIGLDRDPATGQPRRIETLTSNAGALLDSQLLLELPVSERHCYVPPLVERLVSDDFMTEAGVRCRSLWDEQQLKRGADYHGSLVTWPKESYDIAKGLERHGYSDDARRLRGRLRAAFERSAEFREFYFVKPSGAVKYHYRTDHPEEPHFEDDGAVDSPEPCQAWSLSAAIAIARHTRP